MRLLTLQHGGQTKATLTAYTSALNAYSYLINQGVLPVSVSASTIQYCQQRQARKLFGKVISNARIYQKPAK
ncbi:MAG: hypothetical protein ACI8PW_000927 [Methylophilaceae bacterium]